MRYLRALAPIALALLAATSSIVGAQSVQPVQSGRAPGVIVTPLPPSAITGITHLPAEVDIELASQFVKIGFGPMILGQRGFQSTRFLTPRLSTRQAAHLVRLVPEYGSFKGEPVAQAIERLAGRVSGIEFGREGSPVLYVDLPHWTHQREGSLNKPQGERIPDEEHLRLVDELRRTFVNELGAREFGADRPGDRTIRVWWR